MLRPRPRLTSSPDSAIPTTACALLWAAIPVDIIAVVSMIRMGTWLDHTSPMISMLTLGGHHQVVLGLALAGLLLLVVLAPLTHGFVRATRMHRVLLPVAATLSLAASAGLLLGVALGVAAVAVAALLFGGRPRTRIDLVHSRRR